MPVKSIALFLLVLCLPCNSLATQAPRIAAASSLQFVLPEVLGEFKRQTGHSVRVTYGSSGNFRRQIIQGAAFELFLSANESYVDALVDRDMTLDAGLIYALGRIALIVPNNSRIKLSANLAGLQQALADGEISRFAIANPDHAPYGRAAREALITFKLWNGIQPFIIKGENASQATQFAVSGSSQGGIVPYALAISPVISSSNQVMLLPESSHRPIGQRMVLLKPAGEVTRQLYHFIGSQQAQSIFALFGFEMPVMSH